MSINYGQFAPGLADITPGRSGVLDNVVPLADDSYGPFPQLTTVVGATALDAAPVGIISFPKADGTFVLFAADSSKWYSVSATGTPASIGTGYSVPSGDRESFVRFGDYLVGSNVVDGMRAYNFESPTSVAAVSGAPAARALFLASDYLFALDCDGDNRLMRNSDANDHTNWDAGLAASQPFEEGGALIGGRAISNGAAIVFQREAIRLLTFNASGPLYSLTTLSTTAGATCDQSIVAVNGVVFFMDTDGPKVASQGGVQPLGTQNGVASWFLKQCQAGDLRLVEAAYDRFRRMVWWRYKSGSDSDEVYSTLLGYHIDLQRFVTATVNTSSIFSMATAGYTVDDMDSFGTVDDIDIPVDDRFWKGGEPTFAAFDGEYKLAYFSGSAAEATLETPLLQFPGTTRFNRLTPLDDAGAGSAQVGVADRISDTLTWGSEASLTDSGTFPVRARGRVAKLRRTIPAGTSWTFAKGFDHINMMGR